MFLAPPFKTTNSFTIHLHEILLLFAFWLIYSCAKCKRSQHRIFRLSDKRFGQRYQGNHFLLFRNQNQHRKCIRPSTRNLRGSRLRFLQFRIFRQRTTSISRSRSPHLPEEERSKWNVRFLRPQQSRVDPTWRICRPSPKQRWPGLARGRGQVGVKHSGRKSGCWQRLPQPFLGVPCTGGLMSQW